MSYLKKLRKKVGYEASTPTCRTCVHFRESNVYLTTNSETKRSNLLCVKHYFTVSRNGCCEKWQSASGEVLDIDKKKTASQ